ncbi:hypothetical protein Syun_000861 [Stephania yunnanensis]|uniref:Uncharacterized protein n=1 Tax=Stephania yunnanensis TaxID=152371 RepID=A0AAP0LD11_9MAGN
MIREKRGIDGHGKEINLKAYCVSTICGVYGASVRWVRDPVECTDKDNNLVMHRDKDMVHLDREFNVSLWGYGQPGDRWCVLCLEVAEEPSLSLRSPTLQKLFHQHTPLNSLVPALRSSLSPISPLSSLRSLVVLSDISLIYPLSAPLSASLRSSDLFRCLCDLSSFVSISPISPLSSLRSLLSGTHHDLWIGLQGMLSALLEAFQPNCIPDVLLSENKAVPGNIDYMYLGAFLFLEDVLETGNAKKSLPTKEEKDEVNHSSSSATRTESNGQRTKRKKSSNIDATEQGLTTAANRLADAFAHTDCARLQKELHNIPELVEKT